MHYEILNLQKQAFDHVPDAYLPAENDKNPAGAALEEATCMAMGKKPGPEEIDMEDEMCINHVRVRIHIPGQLMKQSLSASHEHRYKLAGGLAAETLKRYPHLLSSLVTDPVPIWLQIRDFVVNRMTHAAEM